MADAGAEDRDTARSGRRASGGADALGRILEDGERLAATDNTLRRSGLSVPNGANSDEVADLLEAFAAVEVELAWQQTGVPVAHLTDQLNTWCRDSRATSNLRELAERSRKTAEDNGDQPQ